jgi:hypothetical protein
VIAAGIVAMIKRPPTGASVINKAMTEPSANGTTASTAAQPIICRKAGILHFQEWRGILQTLSGD